MGGNSFGKLLTLSTFGESHGVAIGGVLDGVPAGINIDLLEIQKDLDRRKPGQSKIVTQRKESDTVELLSGVFEGMSTGTPIGILIKNEDQKSKDYDHIKDVYRPSHADYTYDAKFEHRDYRGGGRSSARETAVHVAAGAIAKQLISTRGIKVQAFVSSVGNIELLTDYQELNLENTDLSIIRCPDEDKANEMIALIEKIRKNGNTVGGVVSCVISNMPHGLGSPVFDKLHADLGKAMLSINAVKGFEYGSGFSGTKMTGTEHNDLFTTEDGKIRTKTNFSGGIQGGISNGEDIYFRVAFKPVATVMQDQETVNSAGEKTTIKGKGRHDPCVVPRAVPIVEAMAALVIGDHLLRNQSSKL